MMKINDLFRTFNMYENIEPLSDEVKVFQCEEADETSSINSALSAISLRSISSNRCNENLPTNDDVQQRLKRIHKLAAARKENKDNEHDPTPVSSMAFSADEFHSCLCRVDFHMPTMTMRKTTTRRRVSSNCASVAITVNSLLCIGAQLLQEMIASVLKPKSRQKEAFMQVCMLIAHCNVRQPIDRFVQNMNFKPDIVTSTTDKKYRWQQHDKSDKNGRI